MPEPPEVGPANSPEVSKKASGSVPFSARPEQALSPSTNAAALSPAGTSPQSDLTASSDKAEASKSPGFLKKLSDSIDPLKNIVWLIVTIVTSVVTGVVAWYSGKEQAREELEKTKEVIEKKMAEDRVVIDMLKEEQARFRDHLKASQNTALDQFYWICEQQKGQIDRNQKTCNYLSINVTVRFNYSEFKDPFAKIP